MICKNVFIFMLTLFMGVISCVSLSFAQVPSTADPGIVIQELGEERRAPSRFEGSITLKEDQTTRQGASTEKVFTLQNIILDETTVYEQRQIETFIAEYLGQPVSFADLNNIARTITRQYRADGYMFSRAVLPPQEIDNGVVHLQAVEGRLTEVEIVGDYKDHNNLIRDMADKLKSEGPTNSKDLERYLLLIDDLPGIKARSLLQPSETPGGGKLILTIEQDHFEGSVSIDNRGSRFLGQTRGILVGAINSLFGIHDRTTARIIRTKDAKELRFLDITHEEQIGTEGIRLKGRYAITMTEPGHNLKPLDVKGDSRLFDLEALYPWIRGRQYNVNLIGGFTGLNSESDILGINVSEDRLRYLHGGGRFDFTDSLAGVTQIDLEVAKGVSWFNATKDGLGRSRANGEHDFFRKNISVVRLQDLPGKFSTQLSVAGQHSSGPLLSSEEFAVGGSQFGRAYDSGEITGDTGISGAVELRYGGFVEDNKIVQSYQFYTFYDVGKVWNKNPAIAEASKASLASAGIGLRFNLQHDISGSLEFNKPLTRDVSAEGDDNSRFFFNVLKRF